MEAVGPMLVRYGAKGATFNLHPFADIHLGNRACAKDQLQADIDFVRDDPYSLWWLVGDYADFISYKDSRFDPEMVDREIEVEHLVSMGIYLTGKLLALFAPIKDKAIAAGYGNHELRYLRDNEQMELHNQLCKHLGVPSFRYSGFFDLYFEFAAGLKKPQIIRNPEPARIMRKGQRRLRVFSHHGAGAAATPGGKINTLQRAVNMIGDADLVVMGHLHEQIARGVIRLTTDPLCRTIQHKAVLALMTGSYLRTYCQGVTGYGEVKLYPPSVLGVARATFRPEDGRLATENTAQGCGVRFEVYNDGR